MKFEPVMVRALIAAVLQLLVGFGVTISREQLDAIDALVVAAIPLGTVVAGFLARRKVTPVERDR